MYKGRGSLDFLKKKKKKYTNDHTCMKSFFDPLRFSLIAKLSSGRPFVDEIRPHVHTHWMMNSEVHI